MKRTVVSILACPECLGDLELEVCKENDGDIEEGLLTCKKCNRRYPISKGIINFIPEHPLKLKS